MDIIMISSIRQYCIISQTVGIAFIPDLNWDKNPRIQKRVSNVTAGRLPQVTHKFNQNSITLYTPPNFYWFQAVPMRYNKSV